MTSSLRLKVTLGCSFLLFVLIVVNTQRHLAQVKPWAAPDSFLPPSEQEIQDLSRIHVDVPSPATSRVDIDADASDVTVEHADSGAPAPWPKYDSPPVHDPPKPGPGHSKFHIVAPASDANPNLCKLMVSASILGYPSPTVVNWQMERDASIEIEGGTHLKKVTGIHEYLETLDSGRDEDLVLILDGFDTWLQLRPDVLIERFYGINSQAESRIKQETGLDVQQKVLIGSQKRCWPLTFNDSGCYAVPLSPQDPHIYGPKTDTVAEPHAYQLFRPRYMCSGVIMGEAGPLKRMFRRAAELMISEPNIGSDQYILSKIFGEQQLFREIQRGNETASAQRLHASSQWAPPDESHIFLQMQDIKRQAASRDDRTLDFGIGLDYEAKMVQNTVFAEDETDWVPLGEKEAGEQARQLQNITSNLPLQLEKDIASSEAPFSILGAKVEQKSWGQVPLFTNLYYSSTPVVVHHNAHRDGLKSRRETMWNETWFYPHMKELLDAQKAAPLAPLATKPREFWPYETWKSGAGDSNIHDMAPWLSYEYLCRNYNQEVFREQYIY